jgi:hypothetical protein
LFKSPEAKDTSSLKPVLRGIWQGNTVYYIDRISGKLATEYTPKETREERVVKSVHSILYWLDRNNPNGDKPIYPQGDSQFEYWEYAVRNYAAAQNLLDESETVIPNQTDDIHIPANFPNVSILGIQNKSYDSKERITFYTVGSGKYPINKVDYYVNDRFIGSSSLAPFNYSFVPENIENLSSPITIKAVCYDSVFNKGENSVSVSIKTETP